MYEQLVSQFLIPNSTGFSPSPAHLLDISRRLNSCSAPKSLKANSANENKFHSPLLSFLYNDNALNLRGPDASSLCLLHLVENADQVSVLLDKVDEMVFHELDKKHSRSFRTSPYFAYYWKCLQRFVLVSFLTLTPRTRSLAPATSSLTLLYFAVCPCPAARRLRELLP